jgi:hypothetical protein
MMRLKELAVVVGGFLLLAAATPTAARAERIAGLEYRGGLPGVGRASGTLLLEGGELRFEDRKGRPLIVSPLATSEAWVGSETKTSVGCILGSVALVPVFAPLSVGGVNPVGVLGSCEKTRSVLLIRLGAAPGGATLRWRVPKMQEQAIADAVNRAAREAVTPSAE